MWLGFLCVERNQQIKRWIVTVRFAQCWSSLPDMGQDSHNIQPCWLTRHNFTQQFIAFFLTSCPFLRLSRDRLDQQSLSVKPVKRPDDAFTRTKLVYQQKDFKTNWSGTVRSCRMIVFLSRSRPCHIDALVADSIRSVARPLRHAAPSRGYLLTSWFGVWVILTTFSYFAKS